MELVVPRVWGHVCMYPCSFNDLSKDSRCIGCGPHFARTILPERHSPERFPGNP